MKKASTDLNLFRITWPIFLELFLFMLMGLADTFMLSAVSDDAVAGVGTANQFIQIAILILGVVGSGASIVVAQYLGSRRYTEASKIAALSITLSTIIGLAISAVFFFGSSSLMRMMNLQGNVLHAAQDYLYIVGSLIFLQALVTALSALIRVHGKTKQTMFVSLGMNAIHLLFNYMFIFGHFGAPALGVEGAAISSVISRALAVIVFFWLLYIVLAEKIMLSYYVRLPKIYIQQVLRIGIPSAVEQVLYQFAQIVFLYYITYVGTEALAARQYVMNISMFIYLFAMAIGMGAAIIVGRYVGAGEQHKAYTRVLKSVRIALVGTIIIVLAAALCRYPLMELFTSNKEIIEIGAHVLIASILLESGRTFNVTIINCLRAAGDATFTVKIGFISMICMSLPLGYILVFVCDLGLVGAWLAIAADEWLRAILVFLRWKSRKWERYAIVQAK